MKTLKHRNKKHDIGLFDSQTGKSLKTIKAVDVTDDLPKKMNLVLLYTKALRGPIVQLGWGGCAHVHYFLNSMDGELHRESVLDGIADEAGIPKKRLIDICKEHQPA